MDISEVTKFLTCAVIQYSYLGCGQDIKLTVPIFKYIQSPESFSEFKQHVLTKLSVSSTDFIISPYYTIDVLIRLNKKIILSLNTIDRDVVKPDA